MKKKEVKGQGDLFLLRPIDTLDVFTPEEFTTEHKDIRRAIDDFVQGEIVSKGEEIETLDYDLSRAIMAKAGELGILGIDIPEKYGGMDLDKICSAIVSERFGYGAGSFTITEINHTGIGTLPVALFGTEEQKQKYLPKLISGEHIGAFGLTESEAGSDALNPLSSAVLSEDKQYYILNGSKQFITNAGFADIIFVYAKAFEKGFTAFIVEQAWEGISTDEEEEKMGMHGTSTRAYHFENVKIPIENVLGDLGKGHHVALNALNMGRFKVGAICIGSAKRAFDEAIKYAKSRRQFGKAICDFGLIKEKIAYMAARIYAAESIMYRTAGLMQFEIDKRKNNNVDIGQITANTLEKFLVECSINKIYGSETEDKVIDEEVQIHGGYGYIVGNHPEVAYRNARINRIWEGTNEINRLTIANAILKRIVKIETVKSEIEIADKKIIAILKKEKSGISNPHIQKECLNVFKKHLVLLIKELIDFNDNIKTDQMLLAKISNIVIEIYAMESAVLRSIKMLLKESKCAHKSELSVKLSTLITYKSLDKIVVGFRDLFDWMDKLDIFENSILLQIGLLPRQDIKMKTQICDALLKIGKFPL